MKNRIYSDGDVVLSGEAHPATDLNKNIGMNGDWSRTVKTTKRVVQYVEVEVNLLTHLLNNATEVYISKETQSVEIRMPTATKDYTHFVAEIPLDQVDTEWVHAAIQTGNEDLIFQRYIDHINWREGYNGTVTK